ncbi:MAG: leucine--tRNA ligase [Candidatus Marinimicrobia bacterium]|jgi:leucyl-tRNA synthetase|nr:leucine--tRNA ligase [Candidatus Neomarinimicrobiota bacterium]|tara:strand:- start:3637 stop:6051 length:2415 start_codon:yes stop_codon:yes gene_type:complete
MVSGYDHHQIEQKWQRFWEKNSSFKAIEDNSKPKYYILDMFPYPSGQGLHVGHPLGYTATDVVSRYKRMKGFNVLHPMGWDAFGLPAEQYALQTGTHPAITTAENIDNFRRQIKTIGLSYDWDREINTTDPKYYKWTQWIFLQLFNKDLAYEAEVPVNWCPELGTVLANEEVVDGKSERGDHPVYRVPMRQWMLKITEYSESLLEGLDELDWPEGVKELQRNWIGRSEGAEVIFQLPSIDESITVFTTRPDTLFGATYMVLAPEHPLVGRLTVPNNKKQVKKYVEKALRKSDLARTELEKEKTGVFLGSYAINPANEEHIPIWISDYVLMTYGTGAIMAVPGEDQRDWDFAKKYDLPIVRTVQPPDKFDGEAYSDDGPSVNSDFLNGLKIVDAKEKIIDWLEKNKRGCSAIQYKLRDWLFSRQRYWGEPFPVIHFDGDVEAVAETDLPVELPEIEDYKPSKSGDPPLSNAGGWLTVDIDGKSGIRETNTMPQWAGSCWYFLRFVDPHNDDEPWNKDIESYWMPVDLYIGGQEHAVLHLLYARFWHHVLYDLGHVSTKEPFKKLVNQGMILGEDGAKMSKSRGNVINPDVIIDKYGADSLRLFYMFLGPLEKAKPWSTSGIQGSNRFIRRVWSMLTDENGDLSKKISDIEADNDLTRLIHQTIKKVTDDIEALRFNTAISQLMILVNEIKERDKYPKTAVELLVLLMSPFTPHVCEELWEKLGYDDTLINCNWPEYSEKLAKEELITIAVQINGKRRAEIEVAPGIDEESALALALEHENVKKYVDENEIKKTVLVKDRLLSIVV